MLPISIRPLVRKDLPRLMELLPQMSSNPTPESLPPDARLAEEIFNNIESSDNTIVLVADVDVEDVIASCTLVIVPNWTYGGRHWAIIENVVVKPEYRHKMVGTRIMKYAFSLAKKRGCYKVELISGPKQEQIHFYQMLGMDDSKCCGFKKYLDE